MHLKGPGGGGQQQQVLMVAHGCDVAALQGGIGTCLW
jgi:hypothetical protein